MCGDKIRFNYCRFYPLFFWPIYDLSGDCRVKFIVSSKILIIASTFLVISKKLCLRSFTSVCRLWYFSFGINFCEMNSRTYGSIYWLPVYSLFCNGREAELSILCLFNPTGSTLSEGDLFRSCSIPNICIEPRLSHWVIHIEGPEP